jgi:hypothetical protein
MHLRFQKGNFIAGGFLLISTVSSALWAAP